jgi:carboxyl-terminal processing protease
VEVELVRDTIRVNSVQTRVIEDDIAYVRIAQFQTTSGRDLEQALKNLQEQSPVLSGIILDLRDNPGGVLQASVRVSDLFLGDGVIVSTQGRSNNRDLHFNASKRQLLGGLPMIVLINKGSASAAEIVAGALQDHGRALVLGKPSFGKGSVQSLLPLGRDRAIKLTTARYYTPSGRGIDSDGIAPDLLIETADDWRRSRIEDDDSARQDPYVSAAISELRSGLAQNLAGRRG